MDADQSFWDDVDALRAMLEEEENSPHEKPQAPSFDLGWEEPASRPRQTAPIRPEFPDRPSRPVRPDATVFTPQRVPQQREASYTPSVYGKARVPRRPSKAALIILYTIIVMELGAISAVAYSWYSWIQ